MPSVGICDRKDCPAPGRWRPILMIANQGAPDAESSAPLEILLCDSHKAEAKLKDFLNNDGWTKICAAFKAAGKAVPTRSLTRLELPAGGTVNPQPIDLYFGCWGEAGHYLWTPDHRSEHRVTNFDLNRLFRGEIDSGLCPKLDDQPQGVAALHHARDGNARDYTALAFWDRTGDSRGNSNSCFIFDGTLTAEEVLARARKVFPELMARIEATARIVVRGP